MRGREVELKGFFRVVKNNKERKQVLGACHRMQMCAVQQIPSSPILVFYADGAATRDTARIPDQPAWEI